MDQMLAGKTIFITGSSSGIGAATAKLASAYGANVIVHGRTESDDLIEISQQLKCPHTFFDVGYETAVRDGTKSVFAKTRIDILVNCAGITNPKPFLETTEDDWLELYRTNVLGTVNMCKAVIPMMLKQKYGRIVNISSIRSFPTTAGRAPYSASKAAINNLTARLAYEFAPHIAVNAVAPGFTETGMSKTWSHETWNKANSCLLKRVAQPDEIAEAILFLASDRATYITGQVLLVDGGYSITG